MRRGEKRKILEPNPIGAYTKPQITFVFLVVGVGGGGGAVGFDQNPLSLRGHYHYHSLVPNGW